VVDPSHPGFVVLQQRVRLLERELERAYATLNNLPGMAHYRQLQDQLEVQKTLNQANGTKKKMQSCSTLAPDLLAPLVSFALLVP